MSKSKIQYIITWIAFVVMLVCSILLLAFAWNNMLDLPPSPALLLPVWILITASGIYLFMLAVKKAHRQWVNDKASLKSEMEAQMDQAAARKDSSKDKQGMDIAAVARKLVRRIPENASLDDIGKALLKSLNRELEIMSGVFYVEKKGMFEATSTFAMASGTEPYSFKTGEGLSGQTARNQQLMVLTRLPEGHLQVYSGLGKATPKYLAIVPLVLKSRTVAVLECSGYRYDPHDIENMFNCRVIFNDLVNLCLQIRLS